MKMNNALCDILYDRMFVHIDRDGSEIYFLMYLSQTPLHQAAYNGRGVIMEILLQNGANINDKNVSIHSFGETDD